MIAQGSFIFVRTALAFWSVSLLLFAASPANASVFLEDLTWTELRDLIGSETTTIIIPIGGTEQSGPAMALGKHNVRVKFLAEKIAERLGNALVAPVIAYVPEGTIDPPTAHMKFPGTTTISDKTFEALLDSAARSFKLHGFNTIVLIGDHGSYQADESAVADRLNAEWKKTPVRVFAALDYYRITQGSYVDKLLAAEARRPEIGTHAGLADTSLMIAVDPSLVRKDRIAATPKFGAADGVYGGDPTRSSAEFGQLGIDLIVNGTTEAIRNLTKFGVPRAPSGGASWLKSDYTAIATDDGAVRAIKAGRIAVLPGIREFTRDGVVLNNGNLIGPNVVIAATGYRTGLDGMVGSLGVLDDKGVPLFNGSETDPKLPGLWFTGMRPNIRGCFASARIQAKGIAKGIARR